MKKKLFLVLLSFACYTSFSQVNGNLIVSNSLCFGDNTGSITVFGTGGTLPYTYSFNNGVTFLSSNVFMGLAAGSYNIRVKDANNILSPQLTANISSPPPLFLTPQVVGNTVTLIVSGGTTPYSFSFNGMSFQSSPVFTNVNPGNYVFQVRDANNCTAIISIFVQPPSGLNLFAFLDSDNDGIKDTNETLFPNGTFNYTLNNNGIVNYITAPTGESSIEDANTSNVYNITLAVNNGQNLCYTASPTNYSNVTITAGVQTLYFPVTILATCSDLSVSLLNYSIPPRPGFIYNNQIIYKNNGNQTIPSGTITFTKDVLLGTIVSTVPSGASISGNSLTYSFTNLLPNELRTLQVNIQVPTIPTINLGQLVINSASITVPANDFNTFNNTSSLTQTVVGSYDPNDKMESHGSKIVHSSFTANDYLRYTIRFENTGTFSAENVRVNDLLNSKLDETSIKMINSSHAYTLNRTGNELNWNFNDINLPPSVPNTAIGHGYITFEIKPKPGYVVGDIIPNTASIFFDFNPPIITNTFNTEFVTTLSIPKFNDSQFVIFPNPTSGILNILSKGNIEIIESISISNVLGDILKETKVNMSSSEIDMSNLQKGLYFINIKSGNSQKTVKVILQ